MKLIKVSGKTSELMLKLAHPIFLDENINYKIGLVGFYSDNNIHNIQKDSCILFNINKSRKHIKIEKGFWSLNEINKLIKKEIANDKFYIKGNNDGKIEIFSPYPFELDISLKNIFGFEIPSKNEITTDYENNKTHVGKFKPKLRPFDVIEIHCNLAESSLVSHSSNEHIHEETDLIYNFFPNVPFASKISEKPSEIHYVPIRKDIHKIQKINVSIMNEKHELLNNENVNNIIYLSLIHET